MTDNARLIVVRSGAQQRSRSFAGLAAGGLAFALAVIVPIGNVAAAITVGVIGDSLSSEYQYTSAPFARNWIEQGAASGAVNVGSPGTELEFAL